MPFFGLWCVVHRAAAGEQPWGHMEHLGGARHAGSDPMDVFCSQSLGLFFWKLLGCTEMSSQPGSLSLQKHQAAFLSRGDLTVCYLCVHCLALSICHNCLSTCPGERQ